MKNLLLLALFISSVMAYGQTLLTQSSDPDLWPGGNAACATGGPNTIEDNHFIRVFDTDNFNVQDTAFFLYFEFGVDSCAGGAYDLIGRMHKITGPVQFSNMTLLAADTAAAYPDSSLYKMIIPFKDGYALPGDSIVAEVFAPLDAGIFFNPGANPYPETGPSFLAAANCGFLEPTTYLFIGLTNIKLYLNLWVNHKPLLSDVAATVYRDNVLDFTAGDFTSALTDYDSDTLEMMRVLSLPGNGTLENNGSALLVGDTIYSNELELLTYTPNAAYVGLDSFKMAARDNSHWSNDSSTVDITVLDWQAGLSENNPDAFVIYPNPAKDVINIKSGTSISEINIFNSTGTSVLTFGPAAAAAATFPIDIAHLPAGIYFVSLSTENGHVVKRLVKN